MCMSLRSACRSIIREVQWSLRWMVLHCPKATQDRETATFFGLDDEPVR